MNLFLNKFLFLSIVDILLTGTDLIELKETGTIEDYYEEPYEIENTENYFINNFIEGGNNMIKCQYCSNEDKETIVQHDSDLVGWQDYGRFFTCLNCRKDFVLMQSEASEEEICTFNIA